MENSKIELIFPYFLSSFSFLPQLGKNVLKNGSSFSFLPQLGKNALKNGSDFFFFTDFHENCHLT